MTPEAETDKIPEMYLQMIVGFGSASIKIAEATPLEHSVPQKDLQALREIYGLDVTTEIAHNILDAALPKALQRTITALQSLFDMECPNPQDNAEFRRDVLKTEQALENAASSQLGSPQLPEVGSSRAIPAMLIAWIDTSEQTQLGLYGIFGAVVHQTFKVNVTELSMLSKIQDISLDELRRDVVNAIHKELTDKAMLDKTFRARLFYTVEDFLECAGVP